MAERRSHAKPVKSAAKVSQSSQSRNVNLNAGAARWTNHALDYYLAPGISKFSTAQIPNREELAERARYWPRNAAFLSLFYSRLAVRQVKHGYVFVRRAAAAVRLYELARLGTLEFLAAHNPARPELSLYARAVDNWEGFLANSEQALDLLTQSSGLKRFTKKDGSTLERLNKIHNSSKHSYGVARAGDSPAQGAFPIWMTKKGLKSRDSVISWAEAAETLDFFAQVVDALTGTMQNTAGASSSARP